MIRIVILTKICFSEPRRPVFVAFSQTLTFRNHRYRAYIASLGIAVASLSESPPANTLRGPSKRSFSTYFPFTIFNPKCIELLAGFGQALLYYI